MVQVTRSRPRFPDGRPDPTSLAPVKITQLAALLAAAALLAGCGDSGGNAATTDPNVAASAPVPGVTLPPGALVEQVLRPDEVPAGMVPILQGSGPRDAKVVASYSGSGPAAAEAEARLKAHKFQSAYVAQYANAATAQVIVVVVSRFATPADAAADFADDIKSSQGKTVPTATTIGEQSAVTTQPLPGTPKTDLVLVRFRRDSRTWSLAYRAPTTADVQLPIQLATSLLARTSP
ncbi:MAG: hypothetical protein JWN31_2228 [Frankiales bacterium]|nr:hypothetical protein [Frankiales bacterium]